MNFLQKGLAGLESRLDKVLLDEADLPKPDPKPQPPSRTVSPAPRRSGEIGKDGGSGRTTMQERLAAAVAKKAGSSVRSASPANNLRRTGSVKDAVTARSSMDNATDANGRRSLDDKAPATPSAAAPSPKLSTEDVKSPETKIDGMAADDSSEPTSRDNITTDKISPDTGLSTRDMTRDELEATLSSVQEDLRICEMRRLEEARMATERVDALEQKLRYLAKGVADEARERVGASDGLDRKLAERDEKIALLIEEGEMMSKNELKLQNTIKRLRSKAADEEKSANDVRKKLEKAEMQTAEAKEKLQIALETHKRVGENSEALENERKATTELKAQIEKLLNEAVMVEEKLKSEVGDLQHRLNREVEKSRTRETDWKAEQAAMESKIEVLRARLEEASSGATGDTHAKLLRQVENLNMQNATARENWQGIQITLESRISSLEKERDDLAKKETDIRKRARDMNSKVKALEVDLENALSRVKDVESELLMQKESTEKLHKRALEAEAAFEEAQNSFNRDKEQLERDHQQRLEEERLKWEAEITRGSSTNPYINSETTSPSPPAIPRKLSSGPLSATESHFLGFPRHRTYSRSASADPPELSSGKYRARDAGFKTPPVRQDTSSTTGTGSSMFPPTLNVSRISLPATPDDGEDYFDGVTPSSPHRHPDIVSVSTVAAGPSVQLVERMSATVRRLESEMAGSREDIARMTEQRDEARKEIVELMQEVQAKRKAEKRVSELEEQVQGLTVKLDASLELLGEKSEKVLELEADIADIKQMYKDLINATMK